MKIVICFIMAILFSSLSFANNSSSSNRSKINQIASDVSNLIDAHFKDLNRREKREVRRTLRHIKSVFANAGYSVDTPMIEYVCDGVVNDKLYQRVNGRNTYLVHDFLNNRNCDEARVLVNNGSHFCDYKDGRLYTPEGIAVYRFRRNPDCRKAMSRATRGLNSCDQETMITSEGRIVRSYRSERACHRNLD